MLPWAPPRRRNASAMLPLIVHHGVRTDCLGTCVLVHHGVRTCFLVHHGRQDMLPRPPWAPPRRRLASTMLPLLAPRCVGHAREAREEPRAKAKRDTSGKEARGEPRAKVRRSRSSLITHHQVLCCLRFCHHACAKSWMMTRSAATFGTRTMLW